MRYLREQVRYWKSGITRRLWGWLVGALLAILTAAVLIRDAVLTPEYRDRYLLKYLNLREYWHFYALGYLLCILIAFIIASFEANKASLAKEREKHNRKFRRYRERHRQPLIVSAVGVAAEPNIQARSVETVFARKDEQGFIVETMENDATLQAIVLPYKNERKNSSHRRVGDISDVSAEVSYVGYDGSDFRLIPGRGAWLSERRDKLPFNRDGSPHRLILLTVELKDDSKLYAVQRQDSTLGKAIREVPLSGDLFRIRVSLFAESELKAITTSDFMLERDGQEFWEKPIFAGPHFVITRSWRYARITKFILQAHELWKRDSERARQETLNADYADWQGRVAEFIRQHYGETEKARFLFERGGFGSGPLLPPQQPSSLRERLDRQLKTLGRLEKEAGL